MIQEDQIETDTIAVVHSPAANSDVSELNIMVPNEASRDALDSAIISPEPSPRDDLQSMLAFAHRDPTSPVLDMQTAPLNFPPAISVLPRPASAPIRSGGTRELISSITSIAPASIRSQFHQLADTVYGPTRARLSRPSSSKPTEHRLAKTPLNALHIGIEANPNVQPPFHLAALPVPLPLSARAQSRMDDIDSDDELVSRPVSARPASASGYSVPRPPPPRAPSQAIARISDDEIDSDDDETLMLSARGAPSPRVDPPFWFPAMHLPSAPPMLPPASARSASPPTAVRTPHNQCSPDALSGSFPASVSPQTVKSTRARPRSALPTTVFTSQDRKSITHSELTKDRLLTASPAAVASASEYNSGSLFPAFAAPPVLLDMQPHQRSRSPYGAVRASTPISSAVIQRSISPPAVLRISTIEAPLSRPHSNMARPMSARVSVPNLTAVSSDNRQRAQPAFELPAAHQPAPPLWNRSPFANAQSTAELAKKPNLPQSCPRPSSAAARHFGSMASPRTHIAFLSPASTTRAGPVPRPPQPQQPEALHTKTMSLQRVSTKPRPSTAVRAELKKKPEVTPVTSKLSESTKQVSDEKTEEIEVIADLEVAAVEAVSNQQDNPTESGPIVEMAAEVLSSIEPILATPRKILAISIVSPSPQSTSTPLHYLLHRSPERRAVSELEASSPTSPRTLTAALATARKEAMALATDAAAMQPTPPPAPPVRPQSTRSFSRVGRKIEIDQQAQPAATRLIAKQALEHSANAAESLRVQALSMNTNEPASIAARVGTPKAVRQGPMTLELVGRALESVKVTPRSIKRFEPNLTFAD